MFPENKQSGFTLIEIMVAISIFAIVATVAISALLTANRINQKAQAIKLVMDNLNFALESMTFKMREGGGYYCDTTTGNLNDLTTPIPTGSNTCPSGEIVQFLTPKSSPNPKAVAFGPLTVDDGFNPPYMAIGMWREGGDRIPLTSSAINITELRFKVENESGVPLAQIFLSGKVYFGHEDSSDFALQTTVSERQ